MRRDHVAGSTRGTLSTVSTRYIDLLGVAHGTLLTPRSTPDGWGTGGPAGSTPLPGVAVASNRRDCAARPPMPVSAAKTATPPRRNTRRSARGAVVTHPRRR